MIVDSTTTLHLAAISKEIRSKVELHTICKPKSARQINLVP